jgi:ubiquinone/menaquinone biosynthesis C-methylase UbiE
LWRVFRGALRMQFDKLAPVWDARRSAAAFASVQAALDALRIEPRRVLDLGTGTGSVALLVAQRFTAAEVVGVDLAPRMIEEARRKLPPELAQRVGFEVADAARLPYDDGAFDLVTLGNMIPFFDELARVVAPGGFVLFAFSAGPETPIWVAPERLKHELEARGFADFADFSAGAGSAVVARKR